MSLKWLKWFSVVIDILMRWNKIVAYVVFRQIVSVHLEYPRFDPPTELFPSSLPKSGWRQASKSLCVSGQKQIWIPEITQWQRPRLWPANSPPPSTTASPPSPQIPGSLFSRVTRPQPPDVWCGHVAVSLSKLWLSFQRSSESLRCSL